jgi:tRNA1(Val) A37 N6-methylase TrmN6
VTEDAFLGDRLRILQPATGYRAGVDAVLLAASVEVSDAMVPAVLDCGAGVGTVGLCVAARCPSAQITLVEREPALLDLAARNIALNAFTGRVTAIAGDITAAASSAAAPALAPETFDHILANPPFHDEDGGTRAHDPLKRASHAMPQSTLDTWARFAARMAKPGGRFTMIHKSGALPALVAALEHRFGSLTITPIHPYIEKPAIRVLISGIKASRAPLTLQPPIVLHQSSGAFTPYVGQILRQGAPLTPQPKE